MEKSGSYMDTFISPSIQAYIMSPGDSMVGDWWRQVYAAFWNKDIWLPKGSSWDQVQCTASDIWYYPILICFVFMFVRYCILKPFVFEPIARKRCIPNKRPKAPVPNKTLEAVYNKYQTDPPENILKETAETVGKTTREVERWLRRRYSVVRLNKYEKFIDCCFKLICHIIFAIMGLTILLPKPWLWDVKLCYDDYPNHPLTFDVWLYHMVIMGYYWATTFEELPRPGGKGSDKLQMILHHTLTILLTAFSFTIGSFRLGALIIFIHEYSDIALLAAKTCHYAGLESLTQPFFGAFVVLWVITRCIILPFHMARSIFFEIPPSKMSPVIHVMKGIFVLLLLLTSFWTVLVFKTVARKLSGKGLGDVRSATEDTTDSETKKTS